MEQKDYILREIEKIHLVLLAILDRILQHDTNAAITMQRQFRDSVELLKEESGFDLYSFVKMSETASKEYLESFTGFNTDNIEQLADILGEAGSRLPVADGTIYMEKALMLYRLCTLSDKTFSPVRENKINRLRNILSI
ncbi:MAG TPA: hypothetical protein ENF21_09590 [Bacteroidetes bacterium]|nr:hypothetical protein [Bacteroidota bacterium]